MVTHPVAVPIPLGCVRAGRGYVGKDQHCKIQQFCIGKLRNKQPQCLTGMVAAVFGGPAAGVEGWGPKHTGGIQGDVDVLVPGGSVAARCKVGV